MRSTAVRPSARDYIGSRARSGLADLSYAYSRHKTSSVAEHLLWLRAETFVICFAKLFEIVSPFARLM